MLGNFVGLRLYDDGPTPLVGHLLIYSPAGLFLFLLFVVTDLRGSASGSTRTSAAASGAGFGGTKPPSAQTLYSSCR